VANFKKCYKMLLGAFAGVALIYALAYVFEDDSQRGWAKIEVE